MASYIIDGQKSIARAIVLVSTNFSMFTNTNKWLFKRSL